MSPSRHTQTRGTYLRQLVIKCFPEIFELAFCAIWVPCTPIISIESPMKMLVSRPYDEASSGLAVIPFPSTIFFRFLNLTLCNSYASFDLSLFCYLSLFMCLSSFSLSPFGLDSMGHQSLMATSLFSCVKAKVQPSLIDGQTSFSKDRFPFLQTPKRTVRGTLLGYLGYY